MQRFIVMILLILASSACSADPSGKAADTGAPASGEVRQTSAGSLVAWDESKAEWVDIETFWLRYAEANGGLTWGKSREYPEYDKVKEFDKLLIELDQGNCLMEFFHSRWRRANDVRRWDDAFNEYGGCPFVFD
ncbi:hypothetical protein ACFSJ3_00245 [Corallincola platygyrae]|uniref:Uncharacterized protein n=1 Tax=Corallincola platygyrae TaxID=1193278 RepID=A0ABW4XG00_9GAMM